MGFSAFLVGFASGWVVRGSVDSSRAATVAVLARLMSTARRVKRAVAIERDHLEDLVAEARARAGVSSEGDAVRTHVPYENGAGAAAE